MIEERRIVTEQPENSETPLERVRSWVTPNKWFFVRSHFEVPEIELATWRLAVEGFVENPSEFTWEDLTSMPERTVFATVECAGNGRSFLQPRVAGVQWGAGAIGHAEWTGVPLKFLLEKVGVKPEAVEVVFEGADSGTESDHPEPMQFARSLPIGKALHPDTLLAYRMNGELLDPEHGFPLRLFVPGWYGVASVKWLRRISLEKEPFAGYYQCKKYTIQRRTPRGTETVVVGPMAVKSEIIRPRPGEKLGKGMNRVLGVSWAGEEGIASVEVSTDGGRTWNEADLIGPRSRYSWCLWEYIWEVSTPRSYSLKARAVSTSGEVQPGQHDPLLGGYMINFSRPIQVQVEPEAAPLPVDAQSLLYDMNAFAEENTRLPLDVELEFSSGAGI